MRSYWNINNFASMEKFAKNINFITQLLKMYIWLRSSTQNMLSSSDIDIRAFNKAESQFTKLTEYFQELFVKFVNSSW